MRIGLVLDHPRRDLTGTVKVAYELAKRGVEAVILPLYEQGIEAPLIGLDAVLLNNARSPYRTLIAGYREAGTAVFVLDTEGGILGERGANAPPALARRLRDSGIADSIAGYFFWGERLYQAFAAESGIAPERLQVTGCPRYDLCHPAWRGLLDYPDSDFILINTNFPTVNPLIATTRGGDRQALIQVGFTDAEIDARQAALGVVFPAFMDEIKRLAAARPGQRFVLRPHPFESEAGYREMFAAYPNLTVDAGGEVFAVIHRARAVIQLNCSTAVEANLLATLPISPEYANHELIRAGNPLPSRISLGVDTPAALDDALDHLERLEAGFPFEANFEAHIRPWFFANDGGAAARVAEAMLARLPAPGRTDRRPAYRLSFGSGRVPATSAQRLQGIGANLLGSRTVTKARQRLDRGRSHKRFAAADVNAIVARLAAAEGLAPPGRVRALAHPRTRTALLSVALEPRPR